MSIDNTNHNLVRGTKSIEKNRIIDGILKLSDGVALDVRRAQMREQEQQNTANGTQAFSPEYVEDVLRENVSLIREKALFDLKQEVEKEVEVLCASERTTLKKESESYEAKRAEKLEQFLGAESLVDELMSSNKNNLKLREQNLKDKIKNEIDKRVAERLPEVEKKHRIYAFSR